AQQRRGRPARGRCGSWGGRLDLGGALPARRLGNACRALIVAHQPGEYPVARAPIEPELKPQTVRAAVLMAAPIAGGMALPVPRQRAILGRQIVDGKRILVEV